ncbi:MAG: DUF2029 domain-containing protein [Chitinophagales bacterium]|nr:DUF2029 domain-containing protein [Chitinophagales bacterium]
MNKFLTGTKEHGSIIIINIFMIFYAIREGLIESGSEDFRIFLEAGKALNQLNNLYFVYFQTEQGNTMPYAYPPFFAMILSPFKQICSSKVLVFSWMLLNNVFITRIFFLLFKIFNINYKHRFFIILFLFVLRFILHNYDMAQVTIFWVYLMLEAFYKLEFKAENRFAAFLIALGISIKILPIVMFLYFLMNKKFTSVLWTIFFCLILNFLPFLIYPNDYLLTQYKDFLKTIYPFQAGFTYQLFDRATQSIPSLISNYNQFFGNMLNHKQTLGLIALVSIAWLIGILIMYKKSFGLRYKKFILFSLTLFSATMLIPHQQHYSFFSSIGLYSLWVYWIWEEKFYSKKALYCFIASLIFMIFTTDLFIGAQLKSLLKTYGAIGIGGILMYLSIFLNIHYRYNLIERNL